MAGYLRRHHVGLLALFVALGGTAFAVTTAPRNSVVSKSIRADAVRAADIDAGAVKAAEVATGAIGPAKLKLAQTAVFPDEEVINVANPSSSHPVEVAVPGSGLVEFYVTSEIRMVDDGGSATGRCFLTVDLPAAGTNNLPLLGVESESVGYFTRRSAPYRDSLGAVTAEESGFVVLPGEPGLRTFTFRYSMFADASCRFRNTRVTAVPVV